MAVRLLTDERLRWGWRSLLCAAPSLSWALLVGYSRAGSWAVMVGVIMLFALVFAECEGRVRARAGERGLRFWAALETAVSIKIVVGIVAAAVSHALSGNSPGAGALYLVSLIGSDAYSAAFAVLFVKGFVSDDSLGGILFTSLLQGVAITLEVLLLAGVMSWARTRPRADFRE